MDKKYQIFVSSTRDDLRDHRDAVMKAILEIGHIPIGMEMFSAADDDSWTLIQRQIDQCDYYLVIVAHRYGSTAADGISYTEKEYDYARKSEIPTIGFIIEDSASWPGNKGDSEPEKQAALLRFKKKVQEKQVDYWKDEGTLQARVMAALPKLFNLRPRPGWVRGTEAASPEVLTELSRLSSENADLRLRFSTPQSPDVAFHINEASLYCLTSNAFDQPTQYLQLETKFVINPRDERSTAIALDLITMKIYAGTNEVVIPVRSCIGEGSRVAAVLIDGPRTAELFGHVSGIPSWVEQTTDLDMDCSFRSVGFECATIVKAKLKRDEKNPHMWTLVCPIPS